MKLKLELILFIAALSAVTFLVHAWRSARHDSQQLAATLSSQNAILQRAADREQQRDKQLSIALATIEAQKRAVRTPQQAAKQLATVFPPLPLPILVSNAPPTTNPIASAHPAPSINPDSSLHPTPSTAPNSESPHASVASDTPVDSSPSSRSTPSPMLNPPQTEDSTPDVRLPTIISLPQEDVLPFYNALQDCRSNALLEDSLQKDLSDEKLRSAELLRELHAAIAAARGGTLQRRIKQAAKWFIFGAAMGATVLAATQHRAVT